MSFFWSRERASSAAWVVSEVGSTEEMSSASWARRRRTGGTCVKRESMEAVEAEASRGTVVEGGRRSGRVVKGLVWAG